MRLGMLGGVFNPPHIGHLIAAQEAHAQLELDVVMLVPVGQAPHRAVEQDPGAAARAEMCELAVAGDARFAVSRIEVERAGPSYTVDTLRELRGQEEEVELFLLLGGDQAASLPEWREPEVVLSQATVAVFEREGTRREDVAARVAPLPGGDAVVFLDMPRVDVSSSLVRRRVAQGRPVRYLVADGVARLIEERGLYRTSVATG